MIIAIDGPSASGKGTLAKKIADHFNLAYLDTGSLYRAVALSLVRAGGDANNLEDAMTAARAIDKVDLKSPELRTAHIAQIASIIASIPQVREAMLGFQRQFAHRPGGAVLDGRDIGSVVCPDADVKLFVTASNEVRARRRFDELSARGQTTTFEKVSHDLRQRDKRDRERDTAPTLQAPDAHLLDTSKLDIEGAFQAALDIIKSN